MSQSIGYFFFGLTLAGALTINGCSSGGGGASASNPNPNPSDGTFVTRTAALSSVQEIPPVATNASAAGTLEVNTTTGAAAGRLTIGTAPTSSVIAAHVHEGARGANGSIVIVLENSGSGIWSVPAGNVINAGDVSAFTAGNLYFNLHTADHPNGEIRGQIDGQ